MRQSKHTNGHLKCSLFSTAMLFANTFTAHLFLHPSVGPIKALCDTERPSWTLEAAEASHTSLDISICVSGKLPLWLHALPSPGISAASRAPAGAWSWDTHSYCFFSKYPTIWSLTAQTMAWPGGILSRRGSRPL